MKITDKQLQVLQVIIGLITLIPIYYFIIERMKNEKK